MSGAVAPTNPTGSIDATRSGVNIAGSSGATPAVATSNVGCIMASPVCGSASAAYAASNISAMETL